MLSGLSTSLGGVSSNIPAYQAPGVTAASVVGAASTAWIASPIVGIFEVVATLVSSLNRVKSKAFQLIVAQNS
jgi:hypothetical protein